MSSADCNTEGIDAVNESAQMVPDLYPQGADQPRTITADQPAVCDRGRSRLPNETLVASVTKTAGFPQQPMDGPTDRAQDYPSARRSGPGSGQVTWSLEISDVI